jgi:cysteine desulfurase
MKPIYLDYQSTTPTDNRVLKKMMPFFSDIYGNPHSSNHIFGSLANDAVSSSRKRIASAIGADDAEIVFTSGATESNNLAIKGAFLYRSKYHNRKKIIIASTEHKCVIEASNSLISLGAEVIILTVDKEGKVNLKELKKIINEDVAIVSVMLANNEIGVIQPLQEISKICKEYNVWLHSDAAQALGNLKVNVNLLGVDLLSISSHKVYGPKGMGCLYVRRKPRIRLISQIDGGGQERLMRSGTLPTPLIVGFSEALKISNDNLDANIKSLKELRDRLHKNFINDVNEIKLNGPSLDGDRLPNNLNYTVKGISGANLTEELGGQVAFSAGSACSTGGIEPSYVLNSIGIDDKSALSSFRISVGRNTTINDIDIASKIISDKIKILKRV